MLRALLLRLSRGMERIREQQQACYQLWLFGAEHAGLASAVGVAAQEDAPFVPWLGKIPTSRN
jgi:hypothetical protein